MRFYSIVQTVTIILLGVFAAALATESSAQPDSNWYTPEAENLVLLNLEAGPVVIELAPFFAPAHVARFREEVAKGTYNGNAFYRVIEGFVAQAGPEAEQTTVSVNREFERAISEGSDWQLLQKPSLLAAEDGFLHNFAAARDGKSEWLVHCPGTVAMARSTAPDSATNHFYVVLGHAPRHLDRNMSIFGRVIDGMEHLQGLPRGSLEDGGVIAPENSRGLIRNAFLFSELAIDKRPEVRIQTAAGELFQQRIVEARSRSNEFYVYKGNGALDICYYSPRVEITY